MTAHSEILSWLACVTSDSFHNPADDDNLDHVNPKPDLQAESHLPSPREITPSHIASLRLAKRRLMSDRGRQRLRGQGAPSHTRAMSEMAAAMGMKANATTTEKIDRRRPGQAAESAKRIRPRRPLLPQHPEQSLISAIVPVRIRVSFANKEDGRHGAATRWRRDAVFFVDRFPPASFTCRVTG